MCLFPSDSDSTKYLMCVDGNFETGKEPKTQEKVTSDARQMLD